MFRLQLDNLPPTASDEDVRKHFTAYNKKSNVKKIRFSTIVMVAESSPDGSQSCLLTFESRSSLEEAANQLIIGHKFEKQELRLRIQVAPQDKAAYTRETSLMVRQLDLRVTEEELIGE